ncbi:uncharacterized protein LOC129893436 [Solanum dulcamara]|uniref:uncharacterized protein LOC129893436 n=1 Tax=Solanum dulcamara TaxID=45834 RepID=UPI0024858EAD|nr:uncharacterized protein LOC129893436 [Solanum dulcamara]
MDYATHNPNGKIWIFWTKDVNCTILENEEQLITCEINHVMRPNQFITTFVYDKCKDHLRRTLWDSILQQSTIPFPWCTLGDFNIITDPEEKLGGFMYNMRKRLEFISTIEASGLQDLGFIGQKYTWCNQRGIMSRIWKRLDRGMANNRWLETMPLTSITHLPSMGSDHYPLLLEMVDQHHNPIKYFKFLNCWPEHPSFIELVKNYWSGHIEGNPIWIFHKKMKRLATTLSDWSRNQFGDIYAKVKEYEEAVRQAEENMINMNSNDNRSKFHTINAEYNRYMKIEDPILRQKSQLHWFKEGDMNFSYFYVLIRGRRKRLYIYRIQNDEGSWVKGDAEIVEAACNYCQQIFTGEEKYIQQQDLQCITPIVTD